MEPHLASSRVHGSGKVILKIVSADRLPSIVVGFDGQDLSTDRKTVGCEGFGEVAPTLSSNTFYTIVGNHALFVCSSIDRSLVLSLKAATLETKSELVLCAAEQRPMAGREIPNARCGSRPILLIRAMKRMFV